MTPRDLICMRCKHFLVGNGGCKAFDQIPIELIVKQGHDKVLPGQKGTFTFQNDEELIPQPS